MPDRTTMLFENANAMIDGFLDQAKEGEVDDCDMLALIATDLASACKEAIVAINGRTGAASLILDQALDRAGAGTSAVYQKDLADGYDRDDLDESPDL